MLGLVYILLVVVGLFVVISVPLLFPMVSFMFVAAMTPGPNNIMLASSGINFGFWRSMPHLFGVIFGFSGLLVVAGISLELLLEYFPLFRTILRMMALGFIVYLAWQISNSSGIVKRKKQKKPQSFLEASSFQFINPKALILAVTVNTTFISGEAAFLPQFAAMVFLCSAIAAMSFLTWLSFGMIIGRFIQNEDARKLFNFTMALILAGLTVPVAIDTLAQF